MVQERFEDLLYCFRRILNFEDTIQLRQVSRELDDGIEYHRFS